MDGGLNKETVKKKVLNKDTKIGPTFGQTSVTSGGALRETRRQTLSKEKY